MALTTKFGGGAFKKTSSYYLSAQRKARKELDGKDGTLTFLKKLNIEVKDSKGNLVGIYKQEDNGRWQKK